LNMMIVVPMLIQTVTFGWIFENLLDSRGTNAMLVAGALLGCAAIAMLWVNPPHSDEDSPVMPLGAHRHITAYDRVIVGSDGSPSAMHAVRRAHEIAAAGEASVVVVTAYDPGEPPEQVNLVGGRQRLYGKEAARDAMHRTVAELTSDRVRAVEQDIVAGEPVEALLRVAHRSPGNSLIVVGNRGLGAHEGEVLGSVPREIVKNADCDVVVIQTSDLDEMGARA
jgi:maltose/moltooligosaccharide transporter